MNIKQIVFERENFSLQKLSEMYELHDIKAFKTFLNKLIDIDILSDNYKGLLSNGSATLTLDEEGYCEFICSFYDRLEWDNYGIWFKREHGSRQKLKTNMEISCFEKFITK